MAYYATYMPNELGELQKVVINAGVGFVLPYYGETAPPGTLACDGSEISREAYKELFLVLGTKAGAGDGVSTFNLPDFRGKFIRGTGGNAAELGAEQGDAIRNINGKFDLRAWWSGSDWGTLAMSATAPFITDASHGTLTGAGTINASVAYGQTPPTPNISQMQAVVFNAANAVPTAAENRPVNVALLWCIIYE